MCLNLDHCLSSYWGCLSPKLSFAKPLPNHHLMWTAHQAFVLPAVRSTERRGLSARTWHQDPTRNRKVSVTLHISAHLTVLSRTMCQAEPRTRARLQHLLLFPMTSSQKALQTPSDRGLQPTLPTSPGTTTASSTCKCHSGSPPAPSPGQGQCGPEAPHFSDIPKYFGGKKIVNRCRVACYNRQISLWNATLGTTADAANMTLALRNTAHGHLEPNIHAGRADATPWLAGSFPNKPATQHPLQPCLYLPLPTHLMLLSQQLLP